LAEEAFARRLPELVALARKDVLHINLDLPSAVATTLGALPRIRDLRPELEQVFRKFNFFLFDSLEDYALVLHHTHADYLVATRGTRCPPDILKEARLLRSTLQRCLVAFAQRGLVDPVKWKHLHGTAGHKNLATDLSVLAGVFRSAPALLRDYPALASSADIERAAELARIILAVSSRRRAAPQTIAAAADLRARAFTLLVNAYNETRHAILYVRSEQGDADEIAPSLFGGRDARGETRLATLLRRDAGTSDSTQGASAIEDGAGNRSPPGGGSGRSDPTLN
jgi:hypothetical protein